MEGVTELGGSMLMLINQEQVFPRKESSTADLQVLSNQVPNLSRGMSPIPSLYSKSLGIRDPEITSFSLRL